MAIVYQISLHGSAYDARGKDWNTVEKETGCVRDTQWRDPIHKRPLLIGEFGCAVSHLRAWEKIAASNRNGIILEEDAVYDSIDPSAVDTLLKEYDSVWLGYRLNTLGYWYNCHAYAIRPETAKRLIEGYKDAIIPVDEWVPAKLKVQSNFFFTPEVVRQIPREVRPSTIEGESKVPIHFITVGTDETQMWAIKNSANAKGVPLVNVAENIEWLGGDMLGHGGGQKINLLKNYIENLEDHELVFFADGYDVLFLDDPHTIIERFRGFDCDILFAAERQCWPDATMADYFPQSGTPYRFLNSGLYAGQVRHLKRFFNVYVKNDEDDQLWCQNRFLEYPEDLSIALDYEGYIFQCDDDVKIIDGQIANGMCCPCIYHGNGGPEAKNRMANLARQLGFTENKGFKDLLPSLNKMFEPAYHKGLEYEEVAPEILVTDFMTESQCQRYIKASESRGRWDELDGDKFPAQEIRLKEIGLWDEISEQWAERLSKICEKHWHPEAYLGLRDAFTMRYSMDTQTELGLHTDASLFTGSVKLNNDYAGAELVFPRQEFTNKDVKVGQCILFPSMVTHGHKVLPLRGGKKYSLTMWTSRYDGDVNS